mmetsp:Transcript_98657/g.169781  ORF Transcript_98657/g.169781 Transcript_98657/m.169781 type:complete len:312 (-) Transcript_98657:207-1142(-)
MEGQQYGTISSPQDAAFARSFGQKIPLLEGYKTTDRGMEWPRLAASLFVPWIIFVCTFSVISMRLHYDSASTAQLICFVSLGVVLTFGFMTFTAVKKGQESFWIGFLFATSLLWWTAAFAGGNANYKSNFEPVYDVMQLNIYPNVDPANFTGNQLMDAGIINFTEGSFVSLPMSMNFVNKDTYCAAPILSGDRNNVSLPASLDFWAVGKNCCGGKIADFRCGGYNNPRAHHGLRLMSDADRTFFRLAVRQAESSFNVKARHPLFLHWMEDAVEEVKAYQSEGERTTQNFILGSFVGQFLLTALAVQVYTKT